MPEKAKEVPRSSSGILDKIRKDQYTTGPKETMKKEFVPEVLAEKRKEELEEAKKILGTSKVVQLHQKRAERVTVAGFTGTNAGIDYNEKDMEIWGCNELYAHVPRLDVLFEIHSRKNWGPDCGSNYGPKHTKWLQEAKIPIYMDERYPDIPMSIPYPWETLLDVFPYGNYINNSISAMIAIALLMEYKEIRVFGVEMAHPTEFPSQRKCVEYWIGIGIGKFLAQGWPKMTLPKDSEILSTAWLYGKDNESLYRQTVSKYKGQYTAQRQNFANQMEAAKKAMYEYSGAVMLADQLLEQKINVG